MLRFSKSSKLCSKLLIEQLYTQGRHFVSWPLRIHYLPTTGTTQVLIWAPKALYKHATDRNRLKRQMREAYRLHQQIIANQQFLLAIRYIDRQKQPYATIERAMCKALQKLKP